MSDNQYYKENMFKRGMSKVSSVFKALPTIKFDAVAGAIGFFVLLIAFLEYKVFESTYGLTGDIILSISVLSVTAFGGVFAEIVLNRNEDATDDQLLYAEWIFYISLITSAFAGFGIWAQTSGFNTVDLWVIQFSIPEFRSTVFVLVTIVTVADILLLRSYFRKDVKAVHARNIARSNSKKKQADLNMEDRMIDFDVEVKTKAEQVLKIARQRKLAQDELTKLYGGHVPADVMNYAMRKLDSIMKEIETGEDLNGDGVVGLPATPPFVPRQQSYAKDVPTVELDPKNPQGGR